jgi:hypothetical protein
MYKNVARIFERGIVFPLDNPGFSRSISEIFPKIWVVRNFQTEQSSKLYGDENPAERDSSTYIHHKYHKCLPSERQQDKVEDMKRDKE